MRSTLSHDEYLRRGIVLMNNTQVAQINNYNGSDFRYRAKAIRNYEKWLLEGKDKNHPYV